MVMRLEGLFLRIKEQKSHEDSVEVDEEAVRLIFNHVGSQKQFLVLGMTWFTEPNFKQQAKPVNDYPQHKSP